jgi:hypothetical protein
MSMTRTLAILLLDDMEVLDFCRPCEVFFVAKLHRLPCLQSPDRGRKGQPVPDP